MFDELDEMMEDHRAVRQYYSKTDREKAAKVIADYWMLRSSIEQMAKENDKHMEEIRSYYFRY